jgi:type VI secretion system protein VasG
VPEPDEAKAVAMLRGVATVLEKHHKVLLLDEAITAAVNLSHRYIPARQLPDKAVSFARYQLCPCGGKPARDTT